MPTWHPHSSRHLAAVIAAFVAMMLLPVQSTAAVYHVYSCRIPYGPMAGDAAPVQTAAGEGEEPGRWSKIASGSGATATNSCGAPEGYLGAYLSAGHEHSKADDAAWTFTSPTGELLVEGTKIWRAGNANGGAGYIFWFSAPEDLLTAPNTFGPGCAYNLGCHTGIGSTSVLLSASNQVEVTNENVPSDHLYINASCSSATCPSDNGDEQGHAVVVYIYATDIALEQQPSPSVTNVSGELAEAEQVSGTASLFFKASDAGSGVYRELVSLDGKALESSVIDETELCKEVPVPAEDAPAFLSAQPCPAQANGRVSLDTENLSNGDHHLVVEVTDAAGNATTVLSKTIKIANGTSTGGGLPLQHEDEKQAGSPELLSTSISPTPRPEASAPSNGTPASAHPTLIASWASARHSQISGTARLELTGGYGQAQTIQGTLTDSSGSPISKARIDISAEARNAGASSVSLGATETDSQGHFVFHLSKQSPSEQITVSYSPTLGGKPAISDLLRLRVRAGVELAVRPSVVSAGGTIHLQGRILGAKIPPGGKQIVLEARSQSSGWLQFLVLRSGRSGRFAGSHRFRLPGPVRYWFRAVCLEEADFPFQTGISSVVAIWER